MSHYDVVVIGAGAAGLMCAITAGNRGRKVLVVDHANKAGKKILMSGGGRCNFINMYSEPENFLSHNPHFCKSALVRYTQWDFIALVDKHGIPYHEKKLGQLFCDNKSSDILEMLLRESDEADVTIRLNTSVEGIEKTEQGFELKTNTSDVTCESLVIATGALSIPTMGATGFGYDIARQFGHTIHDTRAGLVPFVITNQLKPLCEALSGSSVDTTVSCNGQTFRENILFTHRGISGPAILQISSYWREGDEVEINLLPDREAQSWLTEEQSARPNAELRTVLSDVFTKKMATLFCENWFASKPMKQYTAPELEKIATQLSEWKITPSGTEGYRTAEVTIGGVDTNELSSKTMMSNKVDGLYFIGEVVDVTGWLGGFNFQWAWSSGHAAGERV
ncbi:NAD(P)/FAD-dependent oxidoreductase [Alkalimarinus coralli]|uniref:NAD(P)/FAD-dependent oxidoreductase n=1 Tax=Alkalimarinus coralli TaxID=2935863 RepID=UPI00202AD31A|nr:NAD(P)/FAD-dependent oxidoreductase [Alkalimarinus coralli]